MALAHSTTFGSSTTSTAIPQTDSTTLADSTTSTAIPPTDSTTFGSSTTSTAIPQTDSTTLADSTTSTAIPPTESTTFGSSTTSTAIPPTDSTTLADSTTSTAIPPTDSTTIGSLTTSTALPNTGSTADDVEPTTESSLCITFPHLPVCQGTKTVHLEGGNIGLGIAELKPDQQLSIISEPHSVTSLCFYYPRLCMKPEQAQFVRLSDGTGKPLLLISSIIEGRPSSQDHPTLSAAASSSSTASAAFATTEATETPSTGSAKAQTNSKAY
ncbi:cell wall protein DAN4-like [Drosophila persimilis]|uniref:cell wall protein DAN4-like n=1 Tax=Drosophila persimilis TaxID=7234 RepID=UPI000F07E33D|nr:cell wall protein DAN4-like [Drosophila persimilis]